MNALRPPAAFPVGIEYVTCQLLVSVKKKLAAEFLCAVVSVMGSVGLATFLAVAVKVVRLGLPVTVRSELGSTS